MNEDTMQPSEIARETLRQLAMRRIPPTPDNYLMLYNEIAGIKGGETFPAHALKQLATTLPASTAEQRAHLGALIDDMAAAIEAGDAKAYYDHNLGFHDALMDYAGNARAKEIYDALVKETHLTRRKSLFSAKAMAESNAEHRMILDAIRKGDPAADCSMPKATWSAYAWRRIRAISAACMRDSKSSTTCFASTSWKSWFPKASPRNPR